MLTAYLLFSTWLFINMCRSKTPRTCKEWAFWEWMFALLLAILWPISFIACKLTKEEFMHFFLGKKPVEKPTTILAQMLSAHILQTLETEGYYKGEYYKGIYPSARLQEVGHKPTYKIGNIEFSAEENKYIDNAVKTAKALKNRKERNDAEAAKQQKALDIICGTSSKRSTEELPEKLTKDMLITSSIRLEAGSIPYIVQNHGAIQTPFQVLKNGGTWRGKYWHNLSLKDQEKLRRAHIRVPSQFLDM